LTFNLAIADPAPRTLPGAQFQRTPDFAETIRAGQVEVVLASCTPPIVRCHVFKLYALRKAPPIILEHYAHLLNGLVFDDVEAFDAAFPVINQIFAGSEDFTDDLLSNLLTAHIRRQFSGHAFVHHRPTSLGSWLVHDSPTFLLSR
jgi:hypothetical protein